eukprot:5418633-Amphidinium_carterae.1
MLPDPRKHPGRMLSCGDQVKEYLKALLQLPVHDSCKEAIALARHEVTIQALGHPVDAKGTCKAQDVMSAHTRK